MKANYQKTIKSLIGECEALIKGISEKGVQNQVYNRLQKIKNAYRRQLASIDGETAEDGGIFCEGKTATEKIKNYLLSGGSLSSHQANKLGVTSQGNQIITNLRRQGYPIISMDDHNERGHIYKIYFIDPEADFKEEGL